MLLLLLLLLWRSLRLLRLDQNLVIHDILSRGPEHVPDLLGEGHLVLGRGDVLVICQVTQHIFAARLGLASGLCSTFQIQFYLVQGGEKVLDTGFKFVLCLVSVIVGGHGQSSSPTSDGLVPLLMEDGNHISRLGKTPSVLGSSLWRSLLRLGWTSCGWVRLGGEAMVGWWTLTWRSRRSMVGSWRSRVHHHCLLSAGTRNIQV